MTTSLARLHFLTSLGDDHDNVPRARVLDIHTALNEKRHQASIFSVHSLDDPTSVIMQYE